MASDETDFREKPRVNAPSFVYSQNGPKHIGTGFAPTSAPPCFVRFGAAFHEATSSRQETTMARIDRDGASVAETDAGRRSDPTSLEPERNARAELAARFVPAGARVLDLGCGAMALREFLPRGCGYRGCDLVARDAETVVCDLNAGQFPAEAAREADLLTILGALEHIADLEAFFGHLAACGRDVVLSYSATDLTGALDRPSFGWANHLSFVDLAGLIDRHRFRIVATAPVGELQILMRLTPIGQSVAPHPTSVAVISYNDVGNFGDRLGWHMINACLPSDATVHHLTFQTLERAHEAYDLVVLGIGNSLYQPLLGDDVLDVVKRGKAAVGIFGTQYRELIPRAALDRVLDRLDTWFARYEDDVLNYGRGRGNVVHLGDWLIDQFPMTSPTEDSRLHIGDEIWQDLPLDRTIQHIQRFKFVSSTRLHPLLCALTSAEAVSYLEQSAGGGTDLVSGKFRSMLIDVFGRTWPEDTFFPVDRDAVLRYKARVRTNVAAVATRLHEILRAVAPSPPP